MKKTRQASKVGIAPTMPAAAGRIGVSLELVKHGKEKGWTCFKANGGVDCDAFVDELARRPELAETFGGVPDKRVEDALLTRARRKLVEMNGAKLARQLIPESEIRQTDGRMILAAKALMNSSVDSITAAAAMKLSLSPEQANILRTIVDDAMVSIQKDMHSGSWCAKNPEKETQ